MRALFSTILILGFIQFELYASNVFLSHQIGNISSSVTQKDILNYIGVPDSTEKSNWYAKRTSSIKFIYLNLDAHFTFFDRLKKNEKKNPLLYIDFFANSPVSLNGLEFIKTDSTSLLNKYGTPNKTGITEEFVYYDYMFPVSKEIVQVSFYLWLSGTFRSCHITIIR